jgi:serine/threonine-protein kinase
VAETPSPGATPQPRETAAAEEGFLLVAVKPWGRVSIDGKDIGETPIDKLQLSAGIHVVRIRNPGYEPIERRPLIQSGQTERVVVDLSKEGVKKP